MDALRRLAGVRLQLCRDLPGAEDPHAVRTAGVSARALPAQAQAGAPLPSEGRPARLSRRLDTARGTSPDRAVPPCRRQTTPSGLRQPVPRRRRKQQTLIEIRFPSKHAHAVIYNPAGPHACSDCLLPSGVGSCRRTSRPVSCPVQPGAKRVADCVYTTPHPFHRNSLRVQPPVALARAQPTQAPSGRVFCSPLGDECGLTSGPCWCQPVCRC